MGKREDPRHVSRALSMELEWILEAFAPLRFPLAQGLWLLSPWISTERLARWAAILESAPPSREGEDPS